MSEGAGLLADPVEVRAILVASAQAGEAISYSEVLGLLGHDFSRPKMRALCKVLSFVDDAADVEKVRAVARGSNLSVPIVQASDDLAGIYNILYRYLFDRHRDLSLPTSFLINGGGEIVKIYQGGVNPTQVEQDFRHIP